MHNIPPKTTIAGLLASLACVLLSSCASVAQQPYYSDNSSISFETFYQELSPYGSWVHNPQYGQVWIPNVDRGFRPYQTRGYWVMTEYGNTWVSDYAWGWAPFHYGRWYLDDYYGWMWVPGTEWGPAWVAWRSGGGYYGWAPLSPGLNVNVSINIGRRIPRPYWTFVQQRYITSPRVYDYCVPRSRVVNVINHTTVINNTYVYNNQHRYYSGPQSRDIERITRRPVPVHRVQDSRQAGATSVRGGSVAMYRPSVRSRQGTARSIAPGSSRSSNDVARGNSPTRSSYDRDDRSTTPAVRSGSTSRSGSSRSGVVRQGGAAPLRGETRSGETRSGRVPPSETRSMYDNRSGQSSEPTRNYQQRAPQSRTPAASQNRSGTAPTRQRSTTNSRRESRSVPSPSRTRSSYGERSSGNARRESRSVPDRSSQRTRSNSGSTFSRPSSPRSSSPSVSSPSRSNSSPSRSGNSSPSMSRPSQSSASPSSSGSSRSSAQSGNSRLGGSRGSARSRPQ